MASARDVRSTGLALLIAACAALVCVVLISGSQLQQPSSLLAKAPAAKKGGERRSKESFVLNYLKSNKDVDEKPTQRRMHRLSLAQIRKEAGDNTDNLNMMIRPLREAAVGPDGLSDAGDLADISLLAQLGGEMSHDASVSDAIDRQHHVREDTLSFAAQAPVHDMQHEEERIDEGAHYGDIGRGEGGDSFHVLAGTTGGDVDNLGTAGDSDVFKMVDAATAQPSRQDVHLQGLGAAEAQALDSAHGDSEAEEMADPRGPQIAAARREAVQSDKGVWVEPGSNKGYDSFALDSLQVKGEA